MRVQRDAIVAALTVKAEPADEPVHYVLARNSSAGGEDPGDNRRIEVGDEAIHCERSECERDTSYRDVVFEANRSASEEALVCALNPADRKSVVSGKSVSVRVDLGGRRILNKKKKNA